MAEEKPSLIEHPDYTAAVEAARWPGALAELFVRLSAESYRVPGRWARYILPGGTWLQMRIPPEQFPRHELWILRREMPAVDVWRREIDAILEHAAVKPFIRRWWPTAEDMHTEDGGVTMRFLGLYPLETAPGKMKCECGAELRTGDICAFCGISRDVRRVKMRSKVG